MLTLSKGGFEVTGLDFSYEALIYARSMVGTKGKFIVADMAEYLPFSDRCFDAVVSNVAIHMFSDSITRTAFSEVKRVLQQDGLFLFHVGALEDRYLRPSYRHAREIEPNYVVSENLGARRFFSEEYLHELMSDWQTVYLEPVEIFHHELEDEWKHLVMNSHEGEEGKISLLEKGFILRRRLWRGIACR
jgi:ubiquinone/menaquinone biosynthesis C-methylase UbiE